MLSSSRSDNLHQPSLLQYVSASESVKLTEYLCCFQFTETELEVPYQEEHRKYSVWGRDLWDWAMDLLLDKRLTPHWSFDSIRLFKWNGIKWIRFRHEPWTANTMWQIQVSFSFFRDGHILNFSKIIVIFTRWWNTIWLYHICRQDKTLFFWDRERISCPCSVCTTANWDTKWNRHRWWSTSWLASTGEQYVSWPHLSNDTIITFRLKKVPLKKGRKIMWISRELSGTPPFMSSAGR